MYYGASLIQHDPQAKEKARAAVTSDLFCTEIENLINKYVESLM